MNQIALPLLMPATSAARSDGARSLRSEMSAFDATGFEIGWDYARHRLTPPADHLHMPHPVRQGWEAGRLTFGLRTLKPNRQVSRWLQLRLMAWVQGLDFETLSVTPRYLAQIEPLQCPVTRDVLTCEAGEPTEAVVVRLNPQAGFVQGHLATLSRRAAQALGQASLTEVQAAAARAHEQHPEPLGGLGAAEWDRLATLMSMSTRLPHDQLATRPLRALPPNRLVLINPVQALQAVLTQLFMGEAYARRMTSVASLLPSADARRSYHLFMNAMLARRLSAGWSADRNRLRMTLEDAWGHPVIARRWEQLALRLREADCERIVKGVAQRRLAGPGIRWLDQGLATEGWTAGPSTRDGAIHNRPPSASTTMSQPDAPSRRRDSTQGWALSRDKAGRGRAERTGR